MIAEPPSVPGVNTTVSDPLAGVIDEIVGALGRSGTKKART